MEILDRNGVNSVENVRVHVHKDDTKETPVCKLKQLSLILENMVLISN